MIKHDENGPFVRAAWDATGEPQSETVHAVRVEYADGGVEVWNASHEPMSDEEFHKTRQVAWRRGSGHGGVRAVGRVSRVVTVSATAWSGE